MSRAARFTYDFVYQPITMRNSAIFDCGYAVLRLQALPILPVGFEPTSPVSLVRVLIHLVDGNYLTYYDYQRINALADISELNCNSV